MLVLGSVSQSRVAQVFVLFFGNGVFLPLIYF